MFNQGISPERTTTHLDNIAEHLIDGTPEKNTQEYDRGMTYDDRDIKNGANMIEFSKSLPDQITPESNRY